MKKITVLLSILLFSCCTLLVAQQNDIQQNWRLAQQYYSRGEYDKALVLYKQIYESNPRSSAYYRNYYKVLLALKDFDSAEKLIKKQSKLRKNDASLTIDLGLLYKNKDEPERAAAEFDKALKSITESQVHRIASTFITADEYDYAIATYEKGRQLSKDSKAYGREMARAYQKKGDLSNTISCYLDYVASNPKNAQLVRTSLQKIVATEEHMEDFQTQLYGRIQQDNKAIVYPELLIWAFMQQKDFEQALVQAKAIDRRLNEEGDRVMELAQQATGEKDYNTAIDGYEYIIGKGEDNALFIPAKIQLLQVRNKKIIETNEYTPQDLANLEQDYMDFLKLYGKNPTTVSSMRDLSHLYAYYLYDLNKAIALLNEVLQMGAVDPFYKALSKLDLGDYYLMKDEIWESTLLYSQVDLDYKEDMLGEEARFKNAELSYYNGDFEWSQAQLNVLKASTSELISNDALQLSVFITDNLGLDTTAAPMQMFARAALLLFQNKDKAAFVTLDSITRAYPEHSLADDILFTKTKVVMEQKKYDEAVQYLTKITTTYNEDILMDDAVFLLGEIHEKHLNDTEKAMEFYQSILIEHPGSLYIVEARKRYRRLRGDIFN